MIISQSLCKALTELLGHKSFVFKSSPCTGKWQGTHDHYIEFEDGSRLFICNGIEYFNEEVQKLIVMIERLSEENRSVMLDMLRKQADEDARKAEQEGLFRCYPENIRIVHDRFFLSVVVDLRIDNERISFVETSLSYAIRQGPQKLKEHIKYKNRCETYTAGAVTEPTFIFMNVKFSHKDGLYKLTKTK